MELSKYIKSESVELNRSAIHFADYNPRKLSDESRKTLKRGIKKFGLVGGIVVNKRTGLTVVSGHQRLSVMDELQKFPDNDYRIRVDVIDVDEQQEKELNIDRCRLEYDWCRLSFADRRGKLYCGCFV